MRSSPITYGHCYTHSAPLTCFCATDMVLVCDQCTALTHKASDGHDALELNEAVPFLVRSLPPLCDAARAGAEKLQLEKTAVYSAKLIMTTRLRASMMAYSNAVADLHATLDAHKDEVLSRAESELKARESALDAHMKVIGVNAAQLLATVEVNTSALRDGSPLKLGYALEHSSRSQKLLGSLGSPQCNTAMDIVQGDVASLRASLASFGRFRDGPAPSGSLSPPPVFQSDGCGLAGFVGPDPLDQNAVRVTCRSSGGALLPGLVPEDVIVTVHTMDGSRSCGGVVSSKLLEPGSCYFLYRVVDDSVSTIQLTITVAGIPTIGSPYCVHRALSGRPLVANEGHGHAGLALSRDGSLLFLTNSARHCVSVHRVCDGTRVTEFGVLGSLPGQFNRPRRVCTTAAGSALVADTGNCRVQEVQPNGDCVRCLEVGDAPSGVATNDVIIVVSVSTAVARDKHVRVLKYATGALLYEFGPSGPLDGSLRNCLSVHISPDNARIMVSEHLNNRVSVFTVEGAFVRCFGAGALGGWPDADFDANGDALVVDPCNSRLCSYSLSSGELLRSCDLASSDGSVFMGPVSLAVFGRRVHLLDHTSGSLQVFA